MIRAFLFLAFLQTVNPEAPFTPVRVVNTTEASDPYSKGFIAAFALLSGAIFMLWRRVDAENKRSIEREVECQKQRNSDNETWFARVETLQKDRSEQSQKMLDQLVGVVNRSKEAEYATISAITESNKTMTAVAQALGALSKKLDAQNNAPNPSNPAGG